jgi:hypothetical protein
MLLTQQQHQQTHCLKHLTLLPLQLLLLLLLQAAAAASGPHQEMLMMLGTASQGADSATHHLYQALLHHL